MGSFVGREEHDSFRKVKIAGRIIFGVIKKDMRVITTEFDPIRYI